MLVNSNEKMVDNDDNYDNKLIITINKYNELDSKLIKIFKTTDILETEEKVSESIKINV